MAAQGGESGASSEGLGDVNSVGGKPRAHLRVLPPAANWYCSQVCDWGYDARNTRWLITYGAKNGICIYEFTVVDPVATHAKPQSPNAFDEALRRPLRAQFVALLPRGKKDGRVTALRCLRDADSDLRVVCAGEEGAVQIWDPATLTRVDQHRKHNTTEVTAVGVRSSLDPNWIVAGDKQGVLSLWQRDISSVHTFSPLPREAVFSLDVSPRDKRLVAVGYRSGALCVVDVVEKHVRYRLNGHELEVQSCVWAISGVPTPVDYLATASRDRSIKVWAFPHGGSDDQEPSLAARLEVRKPQQASSHGQSTRLWLPLTWTYDSGSDGGVKYGLWTGSFEGNLQLFQWKGAPNGTIKPAAVVKNGHNRLLFGIASLCASSAVPSNVDGIRNQLPSLMATISLDRELRVWREDLTSTTKTASLLTCLERIPAQGGFTYSLDFNASKKLLACGVGDQTIRVWNLLAKPSTGGYQTELVWKGLQSKVTGVSWHPVQDHVLAFGTEDGRVGVWDSRGKTTQRLKVKHAGEVHQLQWTVHTKATSASEGVGGGSSFEEAVKALEQAQAQGESLEGALAQQQTHGAQRSASDVTFFLWSCDRSGLLCRTDVDKDASTEIRKDCGAFAWDAPSEYLAVGLNSGKVDILTCTESSMTRKHDSGVSPHASIFEHKEAVSAASWRNPDVSSACILASSTKSGEILVYEGLSAGSPSPRRFSQLPGYGEHVIAVFQAHSGVVNCLRWSRNTDSCLLASCGDDGAVKVWDVSGRALVSAFHLHANRVFSVAWITSTVLSSCGQDQSIRLWDYENHPSAGLENGKTVRIPSPPTTRISSHQVATSPESQEAVEPAATKSNSKSRGKKKIAKAESVFSMEDVQWMLPPETAHANSLDSAGSARETTRTGINAKRTMLEQEGKIEDAAELYLLEGRITEALRLLASHSLLSAAWVVYAPMAGQDVWREISILYANQLKAVGDHKTAALQYLAVGHVEFAIECFVDGDMYAEAIALITTRLGSSHPLLEATAWQYAAKLEKKKKIEEAASAYLSIDSSEATLRAITILASSGKIDGARKAMTVWTAVSKPASPDSVGEAVVPSSVLVSICNVAIVHGDFALASEAIAGLLHNHQQSLTSTGVSPPSPQQTLYMLSLSTLGIASSLHAARIETCTKDGVGVIQHTSDATRQANHFIEILQSSQKISWYRLLSTAPDLTEPPAESSSFWLHSLATCREHGLWFEGSLLTPDDVVELLSDPSAFDYLTTSSQSSARKNQNEITRTRELLHSSRLVLKLLAELMSGYLLSALEVLRDLLASLVSSQDHHLPVLQLLFPGGLLDPSSPPLFGELADEETDTRSLWAECCLLQCELAWQSLRDDTEPPGLDQLNSHVAELLHSPALPVAIGSRVRNLQTEIDALLLPHRHEEGKHDGAGEYGGTEPTAQDVHHPL